MRVVLPVALFGPGGADPMALDELLHVVRRREHTLVLDPPWDEEGGGLVGSWLASRERPYAEAWRLMLEAGADDDASGSRMEIRVTLGASSDWAGRRLTLEDATTLLQEPLQLYLENEKADWSFLLRAASPSRRAGLKEAVERGRVRVRHGGGNTSMTTHLEALLRSRQAEDRLARRRAWIETWRLWVLFDRDADDQDASQPHRNARGLRKSCERVGPPFHMISRRSIENYLPIAALELWSERKIGPERGTRRRRARAFASDIFGPDRRACYAMKEGLNKDRRDGQLPPPFLGLPPAEERALEQGFGPDIADLFAEPSLPDQRFHEVFEQDPVARELREAIFSSLFRSL